MTTTRFEYMGKKVNLLTFTSDMQCWSFSLTAVVTCPGFDNKGEQSVCKHCYAQMNAYNLYTTYQAQMLRTEWTKELMKTAHGRAEWVSTLTAAIGKYAVKKGFFRGHDSGDFFSIEYIESWIQVVKNLPHIRFWFPTRSYRVDTLLPYLKELAALPNCSIRPSAMNFNEGVPVVPGLADGMGVVTDKKELTTKLCPKSAKKDGTCENSSCRSCWNKTGAVSFFVHGFGGRKIATEVSKNMKNCRTVFRKDIKRKVFELTVL